MKRLILLFGLLLFAASIGAQNKNSGPITFTGYLLYAKAVTPHDTNVLTNQESIATDQYVYVGVAGTVVVVPSGNADGQTITFVGLAAGSFVPVRCRKVLATGTTATNLIGVY